MQFNTSIPNMCPEGQHIHATLSMTILNYIEKIMVPFFIKFAFLKNEIKATEWNCVIILKTPLLAFLLKSLSVLHFINLVFCKIKN